jgi:phytol kinase
MEIKTTLLLSGAFLLLFSTAECLFVFGKVRAEYTRKLVHIGTGFLTILFPLLLHSHWNVLFLCGSFAFILMLSMRYGYLPSINAIQRKSHGSLCYPLAVYVSFLFYEIMAKSGATNLPPLLFFYLPVLIMAICDPAAALVGRRWPIRKFLVGSGTKSLAGSATFFFVAVALTVGLVLMIQPVSIAAWQLIVLAFLVGSTTCLTEAFTPHGFDNLTIPLVTMLVLWGVNGWFLG